ncbi:MAG: hypothetical protein OXH75_24960 [Acidobacteria bacterium]|nr:hypothetical protein [Acidobacteriota bacterium]
MRSKGADRPGPGTAESASGHGRRQRGGLGRVLVGAVVAALLLVAAP